MKNGRPAPSIEQDFREVMVSSEFASGEFRWGVMAGVAVIQDGLTLIEAQLLAAALKKQLKGFREFVGLLQVPQQLLLASVENRKEFCRASRLLSQSNADTSSAGARRQMASA